MFLLSGSPSHVGGINLRQNNGEAEASPPDKAGRAAGLAGPAARLLLTAAGAVRSWEGARDGGKWGAAEGSAGKTARGPLMPPRSKRICTESWEAAPVRAGPHRAGHGPGDRPVTLPAAHGGKHTHKQTKNHRDDMSTSGFFLTSERSCSSPRSAPGGWLEEGALVSRRTE